MPRFDGLRDHMRAGSVEFASAGAEDHYPPDLRLEPELLELELRVDVDRRRAEGSVTHTVRANAEGARRLELDAVAIDLFGVEDLDGAPLTHGYDGEKITVRWAEDVPTGERRRVRIRYAVQAPSSGLFFSAPDEAYPERPRWAATDHETERARHWLPCVDHPVARPRLSLKLRADERFEILANGRLEGQESHDDGTRTAHWVLDQPCPSYLTCFAIGELVRCDDGEHEGVALAYFAAAPFDESHLRRSFGRTGELMAWLTGKLGRPFPYPKYFQFALPGIGGAMENISLVSWDQLFLLDEVYEREWGELVSQINLHEMAHAYFGDMVVIRGFAHAWLKESWATYMEAVWFEETASPDRHAYELWLQGQSYFREARERYRRPIVVHRFDSSWDLFDMHLYPGGARRLHALRCELGDGPFWAGVRDYLERHAHDTAETDDFRRCLERQSGRSLGRFFEQWFRTAGHPVLDVSFEHDAERGEGTFTVTQKQAGGVEGGAVFRFPLELGWVAGDHTALREIQVEQARQVVTFSMPTAPTQVRVNPRQRAVVEFEPDFGDELLVGQLGANDVVGRIEAGRALARRGRGKGIAALGEAWASEPFWGVRAEWARALGKAGSQPAVELLAHLVRTEEEARVLEPLMQGASEVRDPALREALMARLEEGLPYRAAATAWEALGRYGDDAPLLALELASADEGLHGLVASGALRGLGHTGRAEARAQLEEAASYGAGPEYARAAAATSLGALALRLERRDREAAIDRLVTLLRDPDPRVRRAARLGLQQARAVEAAGALEAHRGPLPRQEQVAVDRLLAEVRKGPGPRLVAAEKQVEELRGVLRKLEARLDKLEARFEAAHPVDPRGAEGREG